jgi:anaphase-promoting complex subunit 10
MEEDEEGAGGLREIGTLASWSVTSARPGNGVELLRDGDPGTFWQCVPRAGSYMLLSMGP